MELGADEDVFFCLKDKFYLDPAGHGRDLKGKKTRQKRSKSGGAREAFCGQLEPKNITFKKLKVSHIKFIFDKRKKGGF